MNKIPLSIVIAVFLTSCASYQGGITPPRTGATIAKGRLLRDTMAFLSLEQLSYRDGCTHVFVESVRAVQGGAPLIVGTYNKPVGGSLQEIWVINRCGKRNSALITFQPDARGGTMVGVKASKP